MESTARSPDSSESLSFVRTFLINQFHAAMRTLNLCVARCPTDFWREMVANYRFDQCALHTMFFADWYLGTDNVAEFKSQSFHRENPDFFQTYEELENVPVTLSYDQATMVRYSEFIREKCTRVISSETWEDLQGHCRHSWHKFSRAELHEYNTRHIQHHAAMLSLRLRMERKVDVPWVGTGWKEFPPAR